jgi:hypothetical protein
MIPTKQPYFDQKPADPSLAFALVSPEDCSTKLSNGRTSAVTESPPTDYDFETRAIGDFGSPLGYPPLFDAGECQQ